MSKRFDRPSKHHVVSIHKFATGKAAFNLKRKEVEEQKRNQKSKTLREYAKLCKAEGIVSDRINLESSASKISAERKKDPKMKTPSGPSKQTNPFKDAREEAEGRANQRAEAVEQSKEKKAEIKQKLEMREVVRKQRMKRTKKGQPILSSQIASILGKLQAKT
jgi:predicted  nucleic acid-binding Zn-ribbon protein